MLNATFPAPYVEPYNWVSGVPWERKSTSEGQENGAGPAANARVVDASTTVLADANTAAHERRSRSHRVRTFSLLVASMSAPRLVGSPARSAAVTAAVCRNAPESRGRPYLTSGQTVGSTISSGYSDLGRREGGSR